MAIRETYDWEEKVFGANADYPGHPLLIGILIMDRYQSFAHAAQYEEGRAHYNAISDSFVPGAGCAVSSTMDVLKLSLEDRPDALERAYAEADRYWTGWEKQSTHNGAAAARGRIQAEALKPLFSQRVQAWKTGELIKCPYRLAPRTAVGLEQEEV